MEELFNGSLNESFEVKAGDFLIAEPLLGDPNFSRSVILICEHNTEGSFGFVLNKEADVSLEEASEQLFAGGQKLYIGGPVEQNTLHFIHCIEGIQDAVPLSDGIYWGGDYEQLQSMNNIGLIKENNCRFFVGYSGWGAGQLQQELEQDSWVISKLSPANLFDQSPPDLWKELLRSMGERYKLLSNFPLDPRLN